jgi:UDP-3-O-[3-hydroxymyristoyl] N-acetylglucosamine deacetylase
VWPLQEDIAISARYPAPRQTTLAAPATLSGIGAHLGRPARITLLPAGADDGVVFSVKGEDIPARWSSIDAAHLRMRLIGRRATLSTIEHLMAALAGVGVDNALVMVDGEEIPAMDGSARAFVDAIDEVGVVELAAPRRRFRVCAPVRVEEGAGWAELAPSGQEPCLDLDVEISFPAPIGGQRLARRLSPDMFRRELADARTFGFLGDAERLWSGGLALGASLENTIVLDAGAVLNAYGLRYPDEFVRHKMLDVIGDLALAGAPVVGAFRAYRGGHALNLKLLSAAFAAKALRLETAASPSAKVSASSRLSP